MNRRYCSLEIANISRVAGTPVLLPTSDLNWPVVSFFEVIGVLTAGFLWYYCPDLITIH